MTSKTRYFVIASLLVLTVGLGTGLLAYYAGGAPATATTVDLQLIPPDAQLVAYANVRELLTSPLGQHVRGMIPVAGPAEKGLFDATGINLDTDIDHAVVCLVPGADGMVGSGGALAVVHGVFDTSRIEGLVRQKGGSVEDYKGARLIVSGHSALAFVEPGLALAGIDSLVRAAIDRKAAGSAASEISSRASRLDGEVWVTGRFDALTSHLQLPGGMAGQLPAVTWFSASVNVDNDLHGTLVAEARDQEAADNLREVIRGLVALGKLQAGSNPDVKGLIDSITLAGSGNSVKMGFDLPGSTVDHLGSLIQPGRQRIPPAVGK